MTAFLQFCKNLWALLRPYWTSQEKWMAGLLVLGVLGCSVVQVRVLVIFNSWNKYFYDALQVFDMHNLLLLLGEFAIILVIVILAFAYGTYFAGLLANRWRRWMTEHYLDHWLGNNTFYGIQILNKKIDNPDQRISEDLNEFPTLTISLFSGLFSAVLTFAAFSTILWQLSGNIQFQLFGKHFTLHGDMLWATFIYAIAGTYIMQKIGKNLMRLNYQQEQFNANFRFGLVRVREAAEQIALYDGGNNENSRLKNLFLPVFNNFIAILQLQKLLAFFLNGYGLLSQIVGILIALPRYIHQRLPIGFLMQVSNAFQRVVDSLSYIVNAYTTIASWRAAINRLTEFREFVEDTERAFKEKHIVVTTAITQQLKTKNIDITLPNGIALIKQLNLEINAKESLLITGDSGAGKSTLLRALANIWPYGEGAIELPKAKILFLPQKPYLPLGTLRDALTYPSNHTFSDTELTAALKLCGLHNLEQALNETHQWAMEFSLGEQQLLAFARIFLQKPDWVFLDEATSALDENNESKMYQLLKETLPNITIVSVGHRKSLTAWHEKTLHLSKTR